MATTNHISEYFPSWLKLVLLLIFLGIFAFEIFSGIKYGVVTRAGKPCRQSEKPVMFWFLFVLDCSVVGGLLYFLVSHFIFGFT